MVAGWEGGLEGDEKCEEIKKYKLVVPKQSQGVKCSTGSIVSNIVTTS